MVYSAGDREQIGNYEHLIEPPNEIDETTGVPAWYGSDEEAFAEFQAQFG